MLYCSVHIIGIGTYYIILRNLVIFFHRKIPINIVEFEKKKISKSNSTHTFFFYSHEYYSNTHM